MSLQTEGVQADLQAAGTQYLRVLWCDHAGVIRARSVRVRQLDGVRLTIPESSFALPVTGDRVAEASGLGPVGEVELAPDWNTLRHLPYAPGEAQVIGDLRRAGQAWALCPRAFLNEQIARLAAQGLSVLVAFENEFSLLRRTWDTYEPLDVGGQGVTSRLNPVRPFLHAFTEALEEQGVEPLVYHPEAGAGGHELSLRPSEALSSADGQLVFRETARGVAAGQGFTASFLPIVAENAPGNACHLNLSLWYGGENVTGDPHGVGGLSGVARAFIAGVLAHLPGLCALTMPSHNSYAGGRAYRSWGTANGAAAVRVSAGAAGASHFELRTADGSANPYLALGALIAAGLDGVERSTALAPETAADPATLGDAERKRRGVEALPGSLEQAVSALEQDQVLRAALGPARAQAYLAVRRAEWAALNGVNLADELRLLAERY